MMLKQKLASDNERIELCESFRRVYFEWDHRISTGNTSRYDVASDGSDALRELRNTWGDCLAIIQEWRPKTLRGAEAKFDVASMWSKWSGGIDGAALPFLDESKRELQSFSPWRYRLALAYLVVSINGERKIGSPEFLARLGADSRLEADASIGARRSQT
jgi:hypothetical protein